MLASDLATALDPARLMEGLGLVPDPWQSDLLRSNADRALLLCSRQAGKSTVTAALALHEALYHPPALVLLLSPSLRQSGELFRKVIDLYRRMERPKIAEQESALRLELSNGSRVVSLPGKEETVRGFSGVRLLIIDEASRVADSLYYSVRPMLAVSRGRLVCLTTPFGKRGFFFNAWNDGSAEWRRVRVPATDCPRITAAFLEEERRSIGDWWFRQEYLCEFTETMDQVFTYDQVAGAVSTEVRPLFERGIV
jgi:hypothetical protein